MNAGGSMRFVTLLCVGLLSRWTAGDHQVPAPSHGVSAVQWMTGCWSGTRGDTTFHERWTRAGNELLLGVSYSIDKAGKVESFEFLRVEVRGGQLVYVAQPNGRPETVFTRSLPSDTNEAMFANPAHDFPKRVSYKRTAAGVLASIDDGTSGKRMEFPMSAVSCDVR
jgi:hypothetical protein